MSLWLSCGKWIAGGKEHKQRYPESRQKRVMSQERMAEVMVVGKDSFGKRYKGQANKSRWCETEY